MTKSEKETQAGRNFRKSETHALGFAEIFRSLSLGHANVIEGVGEAIGVPMPHNKSAANKIVPARTFLCECGTRTSPPFLLPGHG